ncbi:Uncharacterized protein Fot_09395 [Forsythia ovata]|uniref:Uncharacterized protein n=1 Tax=Forsythia ovata TaxID=205694 RepID=A0ABD1WHK8_9LAMI
MNGFEELRCFFQFSRLMTRIKWRLLRVTWKAWLTFGFTVSITTIHLQTELYKRFSNCNEKVEKTLEKGFEIRSDAIILMDMEDAAKEEEIEAQILIQQPTMSAIASLSTPLSITGKFPMAI